MPRLIERLEAQRKLAAGVADVHAAYEAMLAELHRTSFLDHALRLDDPIPDFLLPNAEGRLDPALGTLTAAIANLSGLLQPLLEIFNTGRSQVDLAVQEFLNLGTLQARTGFSFGGFIPDNTPVYGLLFPPMPVSASTSLNGQLAQFTGLGGLPFVLTLASPATIQQGPTVTGVSSSASANGTITLDYTYTPAPLAVVGAGLLGLGLIGARRRAG